MNTSLGVRTVILLALVAAMTILLVHPALIGVPATAGALDAAPAVSHP